MDILQWVLRENKLSKKESTTLSKRIEGFVSEIGTELARRGIAAEVMLGGSAAKGTIIKGDFDCDLFVRFDYKYQGQDLSGLLSKAIARWKPERLHGSRDYFQITHHKLTFELVPVLKIEHAALADNVTDMSPLHVRWIEGKIAKRPTLQDQIIIAKRFCKAQSLYGAESYIGGFSGHVLDILIVNYGSFHNLLKAAASWRYYQVIDVEKYGTAASLNESKRSPLIIIDPVDPSRNAAAALTGEKFLLCKELAKRFLAKPSRTFFQRQEVTKALLKRRAGKNRLVVLDAKPASGKRDVQGAKILKVHEHFIKQLKLNDFRLVESGWDWDGERPALLWYILDPALLSEIKVRQGPSADSIEADNFKQKHTKVYVKEGRLYADLNRKYRRPEQLLKALSHDVYTKQRSKMVKVR
jgi:tRNA nucleotidyltransferase (CCA-adding enzyme)